MIPTYGYLPYNSSIALLIKNVNFLFLLQTANISFSKRVSKTRHSHLILVLYNTICTLIKNTHIYSKITCSEIVNFKKSKIGTCIKYVRTSYFFSQRMKKKLQIKLNRQVSSIVVLQVQPTKHKNINLHRILICMISLIGLFIAFVLTTNFIFVTFLFIEFTFFISSMRFQHR